MSCRPALTTVAMLHSGEAVPYSLEQSSPRSLAACDNLVVRPVSRLSDAPAWFVQNDRRTTLGCT